MKTGAPIVLADDYAIEHWMNTETQIITTPSYKNNNNCLSGDWQNENGYTKVLEYLNNSLCQWERIILFCVPLLFGIFECQVDSWACQSRAQNDRQTLNKFSYSVKDTKTPIIHTYVHIIISFTHCCLMYSNSSSHLFPPSSAHLLQLSTMVLRHRVHLFFESPHLTLKWPNHLSGINTKHYNVYYGKILHENDKPTTHNIMSVTFNTSIASHCESRLLKGAIQLLLMCG